LALGFRVTIRSCFAGAHGLLKPKAERLKPKAQG